MRASLDLETCELKRQDTCPPVHTPNIQWQNRDEITTIDTSVQKGEVESTN